MSIDSGEANQLQRALAQSIREHWTLFLIEGIVLVVLGLLAIIIPPIATIAVTIFLGWLFLISGVVGLVTTFWARHAPGFWWSLLVGGARDRRRYRVAGMARQWRRLADAAADRVLHHRRRRHDHVCARAQEGAVAADGAGC